MGLSKSEVHAVKLRYKTAIDNNNTSTQVEIIKLLAASHGVTPSCIFKIIKGELGENIGTNLKILRLLNNLTQKEVAESTCLSCDTISALERGKHTPQRKSLQKIVELFGVSIEDI
ncbi:helix-turn-helix transcriptional regulator [Cytobacillus pseudoceanisediminis]